MKQVNIRNYGNYSSDNYGAHSLEVHIGDLTLYFSYDTVVAFQAPGIPGIVVSENCWSTTTGKHLNWIDDGNKKARVKRAEFEHQLKSVLAKHKLIVR